MEVSFICTNQNEVGTDIFIHSRLFCTQPLFKHGVVAWSQCHLSLKYGKDEMTSLFFWSLSIVCKKNKQSEVGAWCVRILRSFLQVIIFVDIEMVIKRKL